MIPLLPGAKDITKRRLTAAMLYSVTHGFTKHYKDQKEHDSHH
jgi:hypothetical protein